MKTVLQKKEIRIEHYRYSQNCTRGVRVEGTLSLPIFKQFLSYTTNSISRSIRVAGTFSSQVERNSTLQIPTRTSFTVICETKLMLKRKPKNEKCERCI